MIKNIVSGRTLLRNLSYAALMGTLVVAGVACSSSSDEYGDGVEYETVSVPTQGVITELEETPEGDFLISDETIIDNPDSSKAVITYADGSKEIVPVSELKADSSATTHRRGGSVLRSVMMYSLLSRVMGGGGGMTPNAGIYKTPEAHSKSTGLSNQLQQSSTTRTVARPRTSSSGFGSSRSTRSYGG